MLEKSMQIPVGRYKGFQVEYMLTDMDYTTEMLESAITCEMYPDFVAELERQVVLFEAGAEKQAVIDEIQTLASKVRYSLRFSDLPGWTIKGLNELAGLLRAHCYILDDVFGGEEPTPDQYKEMVGDGFDTPGVPFFIRCWLRPWINDLRGHLDSVPDDFLIMVQQSEIERLFSKQISLDALRGAIKTMMGLNYV